MDKIERRKVQLDNQPITLSEFANDLENLSDWYSQKGLNLSWMLPCINNGVN